MADNDDIVQNVKVNIEAESADGAFDQLKQSLSEAFQAIRQVFNDFDFGAAWDKIKDAGAKAFEALKNAGTESLGNLAAAAEANAEKIGTAFIAVGAAVAAAGVAVGLAGRLMFSFAESAAKAVNAMGELADKTQTAIQDLSAMQSFFAQAGVGPQEFERAYNHLGQTVSETWSSIKKEVTEGTDKIAQTHLVAAQAVLRLQDAQREAAKTGSDLAKQQRDDANSVADAQRRLEEAEIAKQKSQGIDTSFREKQLANQKLDTDLQRAQQSVKDAQNKQDDDAAKAQEEGAKRQLAVKQATLALDQAQRNSRQTDRNDLNNITRSVQDLAGGNADALRNFNATADNILKGIVASSAQAGAAIKGLGVDFSGLSDTGPKVKEVLLQLGAVLNNINDPILRNQVAFKALGGASQDFINALRTGGIDEFIAKMGELGGALTPAEKKIGSDFVNSLTKFGDTLDSIKDKVGIAFGDQFISVLDSLNSAFERSRDNIVRFAEVISSIVGPPFKALAASINVVAQVANTVIDIFRNLSEAIKSVLGLSDIPLIKSLNNLYEILKAITKIITGDLKGGIEDLKKQSAKELQDTFKKDGERAEENKKPTPGTPQSDPNFSTRPAPAAQRDKDGFPVGLSQVEKDAINFRAKQNEDEAARSRGIDPNAKPPGVLGRAGELLNPAPAASRLGELLDPRPLLNQLFNSPLTPPAPPAPAPGQPGAPAQPATQQGILDTLQGIGQKLQQNIDSHFQGPGGAAQPGTPGQPQQPVEPQSNTAQDLFGKLGDFISRLNQPDTKIPQDDSGAGIGIRGSLDDASAGLKNVATAADAPVSPLQQLATEAGNAAAQLANVKVTPNTAGTNTVTAAEGGHVQGAGTSTSDSIDAKLSHGEYVLKKTAVDAVGVPWLNWLNRQVRRFADGGKVDASSVSRTIASQSKLPPGDHEITYDPNTGGAFIDGVLHTPPDPLLSDPTVQRGIEQSKAGMKDQSSSRTKHSDFTGVFGGHVFGESGSYAGGGPVRGPGSGTSDSILARLSNNEFVQPERATRHYGLGFMEAIRNLTFPKLPQFALGGLVSPRMPRFATGGPVDFEQLGSAAMPHLGSVDLTHDYGTARIYADRDTVGDLKKAAVRKNTGSQRKSGWVG